uniref:Ig-like domain-containing protein n=1 Tax=Amphilophus citrinellus TaxID=61819 RepID=A0A3Q0QRA0_AMPCI
TSWQKHVFCPGKARRDEPGNQENKSLNDVTTVAPKPFSNPNLEPSFLKISSIPQIPKVERLLVLCCRVENFYPKDINLEWYRNDGEQVHIVTHFGPFSDHSRLYSVWSKIELIMAREDERAVYTCRVYHSSFQAPGYKDVFYHINTQGSSSRCFLHLP